jgi:hypothetical protein
MGKDWTRWVKTGRDGTRRDGTGRDEAGRGGTRRGETRRDETGRDRTRRDKCRSEGAFRYVLHMPFLFDECARTFQGLHSMQLWPPRT